MRMTPYVIICVIVTSFVTAVYGINWLALVKSQRAWNRTRDCRTRDVLRLGSVQRALCSGNLDLMPAVTRAARTTSELCQQLFDDKRWNCSSVLLAPKFTPDLTGGSREQAFVYALSSASVLQAVAKTCSSGAASKCGCGRSPPVTVASEAGSDGGGGLDRFKWGGCADNVEFGAEFSSAFCDARWAAEAKRRRRNRRATTNLHNNHAGRTV